MDSFDADGNKIGTTLVPVVGAAPSNSQNVAPSEAPVGRNAGILRKINENAMSTNNSGPVVINNSTVNNNGAAGTGSVPGPATGGAISTAPQRSPLDNVLYGRAFSGGHQ